MRNITQQEPAPAQSGTLEAKALRKLGVWRQKERASEADGRSRDKQREEYRARRELSGAADDLNAKAGQP